MQLAIIDQRISVFLVSIIALKYLAAAHVLANFCGEIICRVPLFQGFELAGDGYDIVVWSVVDGFL